MTILTPPGAGLAALAGLCVLHSAAATANATCCECAVEQDTTTQEGSVAFAFAMSIGAGMCTTIGGAIAFLGKIEDTSILAISLAISAGVMIYVSFIEIFVKSLGGFTDQFVLDGMEQGTAERNAYYAATGFFFLGMVLTKLLDMVLAVVQARAAEESIVGAGGICDCDAPGAVADAKVAAGYGATSSPDALLEGCVDKGCAGCLQLPAVETIMAKYDSNKEGALNMSALKELVGKINAELKTSETAGAVRPAEAPGLTAHGHGGPTTSGDMSPAEAARLQQMGMFTALSIFIHNFPEGLATVTTPRDPPSPQTRWPGTSLTDCLCV